ncbi:aromatic ring-hydroxylating dioxygenase subunit alpha [Paraburkholderia xenovorans]
MASVSVGTGYSEWEKGAVSRIPYKMYFDESVYEQEQEKIYRGPLWHFLGMEAEVPKINDFKSTFVGETPVVLTRTEAGGLAAWVNRCAHRGAMVTRERRGNKESHQCVYHQWAFDSYGDLVGVPFRRGIAGKGGYPKDFSLKENGLTKLRVEAINGVVFATFDDSAPTLREFLGESVCAMMNRICGKPLKLLGYHRQHLHGNWKLYLDNTRDPYHASLLHLFHATFGLYRSSQEGFNHVDGAEGMHSILCAKAGTDDSASNAEAYSNMRSFQPDTFTLQGPSILKGRKEFNDGISLTIMSVFPGLVVQQIANSLCLRQVIPSKNDETELIWHFFGYQDDDEEMDQIRLKQMNLVGPGGLISMEDGEAVELVNRAVRRDGDRCTVLEMGGRTAEGAEHLVTEGGIRSMWAGYRKVMGI